MKKIILLLLLLLPSTLYAYENLTETEARITRKGTNTFYSGATVGNGYIFQPQTLIYNDTTSGHEVIVFTQTDNKSAFANYSGRYPEYGVQWWSADGKRLSYYTNVTVSNMTYSGNPWFVSRSDGTYLRGCSESTSRGNYPYSRYFDWSPTEPDVAFHPGNNDGETDTIYKVTIGDTPGSYVEWVDSNRGSSISSCYKGAISPDGRIYMGAPPIEGTTYYVFDLVNKNIKAQYSMPTLDTYWGDTVATDTVLHDEWLVGNWSAGYWWIFYTNGEHTHWRMQPWGTDGSSAPVHVIDNSATPYTWWNADGGTTTEWDSVNNIPGDANKELQPINGNTAYGSNFPAHFIDVACDEDVHYWSHDCPDRYGRMVVYHDTPCYAYQPLAIWDIDTYGLQAKGPSAFNPSYTCWTGFSDYAVGARNDGKFAILSIAGDSSYHWVADLHKRGTGDEGGVHPSQSPDGTKIGTRSDWFNSTNDIPDMFVLVAYYPYPPEITACTATGGTVTTTFEWMLDGASPRAYNTRGWPHPDNDDPAPPRETSKFRLWRKPSTGSTWTPLSTTNAAIFTRYDFSAGTWSGNDYWTINDAPGNGTWDYAVTSVEWSGLESKAISNTFRITVTGGSDSGSQQAAYPSDPGKLTSPNTSGFYTSYNATNTSLIRHYNIYAQDGSAPSVTAADRIASIPASAFSTTACSYVDWLGHTSGTTQYVVTAVDTQGNESTALTGVTGTHKKTGATADGQYTVEWTGGSAPTSVSGTINAAGTTLTLAMSEFVTNNYPTTLPTLSMSGGAVTASCLSCLSGTSLTYTLSRAVHLGETGTYSWDVATNGVEDVQGDDLADISGAAITNSSTHPYDTTPDAFIFTDITGAALSTVYTSNAITVAGIEAAAAISITGGTYSINGGAYTAVAGTITVGQTATVRVTSSASTSTTVNGVLTIGGVSDTYSVTTLAPPSTPTGVSINLQSCNLTRY